MGDIVIVAYRAKDGQDEELLTLLQDHVPALRRLGLATDRPSVLMRASDGTFIEVFEWREGAIERAHGNPHVQGLWARYAKLCDYVPLKDLQETSELFAGFKPVADTAPGVSS